MKPFSTGIATALRIWRQVLSGAGPTNMVIRAEMGDAVRELFADDSEVALFYFAGHGHIGNAEGFLCDSDTQKDDDGSSLTEVIPMANASKAKKSDRSR